LNAGSITSGSTQTLGAVLESADPATRALISSETGSILTREDLLRDCSNLAGRLTTVGMHRGACVAVSILSGSALIKGLFAIVFTGSAAATLNPSYRSREFSFYLQELRPDVLLLPEGEIGAAREAAVELPGLIVADLGRDEPTNLSIGDRLVSSRSSVDSAESDDVALLLHTSETTSRPKQAPLLHRNLAASIHTIATHYRLAGDDVSYCLMPLFHMHGLVASTWTAPAPGRAVLVPARSSPSLLCVRAALAERGVTWFSASPTIHRMVLEHRPSGASEHGFDSYARAARCSRQPYRPNSNEPTASPSSKPTE
jgi:acyl-CoA synthetase (AMP-forming)/AMP-acid ligase II